MGDTLKTLLLIIACAPILYSLARICTTYLLIKLSRPHFVVIEYETESGKQIVSTKVDVSKDPNFYRAVNRAYRAHKKQDGVA